MREIPLTRGCVALIDDEDYGRVVAAGSWAAYPQPSGKFYAARRFAKGGRSKTVYLHQFLMMPPPGHWVDHINGDGLDCRRSTNLRCCTPSQNRQNAPAPAVRKAPFKGIAHRSRNSWQARITLAGRTIQIGSYPSATEAALAYDEAAKLYFGEFAHLNFPNGVHASETMHGAAKCLSPPVTVNFR